MNTSNLIRTLIVGVAIFLFVFLFQRLQIHKQSLITKQSAPTHEQNLVVNKKEEELYPDYEKIEYQLEGKNLRLLVADTPEKREKGLMFYRSIEGVDGMIFIFPSKHYSTFWNKNTFMDLDIYWIDGEKIVGTGFLPSIEKSGTEVRVSSPELIDKVIEVPRINF